MSTKLTSHTEIRCAIEGKTIRSVLTRIYDGHGLNGLQLMMTDGTVIDIDCREKNGGAILEVDKMY